jgi:hypothetical protein
MAGVGLEKSAEIGWPRGIIRAGDSTLIPEDGLYDGINALLGDDGIPAKRGGSSYKSNAAFNSSGLRSIWDGDLAGGPRQVFQDPTNFGQLGADDATPVQVAVQGSAFPGQMAVLNGILYFETGSGGIFLFAGTRKTAAYTTGTVDVTNGSRTVVGHGTSWNANVDSGMIFWRGGTATRRIAVESVESNTSLTLREPWGGATVAGSTYRIEFVMSHVTSSSSGASGVAAIAGRVVFAKDDRIYYSEIDDIANVPDVNFHAFEALVVGLGVLRDDLLVFTNRGTWVISGMQNPLADPAGNPLRRQELVNKELILWHRSGIGHWRGALIVPGLDAVWLMDAVSGPVQISQSIEDLYRNYILAGYRPGGAGVRWNTYFLPILDSSANVIDLLSCRLTESRAGPAFAWTRQQGSGANVTAVANRASQASPLSGGLYAAGRQSSSRVLRLNYTEPVATDHDGTAHQMELVTGDIGTGGMVANIIKRIRARYDLQDPASVDPYLEASVAKDGGSWTVLSGPRGESGAPEASPGRFTWPISRTRARYVKFRLRTVGACVSTGVRSLEVFIRRSGRS